MSRVDLDAIRNAIRDVPDFPKPGILFKDITPVLNDARLFAMSIDALAERHQKETIDRVAVIDARGFIFGAAIAVRMGLPLQLVRKAGKLPHKTIGVSYDLEYGSDRVEMHEDAVIAGKRYAVIDDLIATGGTAGAAAQLIEQHNGVVACFGFVIELSFLDGRAKLGGHPVEALISY